jgi:hypothetical protein
LVNAYVGETKDSLSSVVDSAEVNGRLSVMGERLQVVEDQVDDKITEKIEGKCQVLNQCIEGLANRSETLEESRNDILDVLTEVDLKIKVIGKLIESTGNGIIKVEGNVAWCSDDIKGLKRLGIDPLPFTLDHVKG